MYNKDGQKDRQTLTVAVFAADRGLGTGPVFSSALSCRDSRPLDCCINPQPSPPPIPVLLLSLSSTRSLALRLCLTGKTVRAGMRLVCLGRELKSPTSY